MDCPYVAKVLFKSTKNCLISVPQQWLPIHATNSLEVFEMQFNGHQKAYFSWSGENTSAQQNVGGHWTVEINGFYALKLGLYEGQEVLVSRKVDITTSLESVSAEPVAVDDWEILEIHANYVQDNLMNQVRVVWSGQLLPIWVNPSVCILVKISGLMPGCPIGILEQMTEIKVTPKSRSAPQDPKGIFGSQSAQTYAKDQNVPDGPAPQAEPRPPEPEVTKEDKGRKWTLGGLLGNVFGSWRDGNKDGAPGLKGPSPQSGPIPENPLGPNDSESILPVVLRVHPHDPAGIQDEIPDERDELRILLSQPSTVIVSSRSLTFLGRPDRRIPVVLAKVKRVEEPAEPAEKKSEKNAADKSKGRSTGAAGKSPRSQFVKVVILDFLAECLGDSSAQSSKVVCNLRKRLIEGALLMHGALRGQTGCGTTSRVRLDFGVKGVQRPTALTFYPLQNTVEENTELNIHKNLRLWLHRTTSLNCPLVTTNGTLVEIVSEEGKSLRFLVRDKKSSEDRFPLLVTSSVQIDLKMDTCIQDSTVHFGNSDIPPIGTKSENWGGIRELVHQGSMYLKSILHLGPLSQHLRHPQANTPSGGGLLICGGAGTGRSTLAHVLCRDMYEAPYFVFAIVVACKSLKGKRVESIVRIWKKAYREAQYRTPSIVVLDDLDALVGSPSGPENEIGAMANYQTRLAEALYGILKSVLINERAKIATIGTCKGISSLHKILASPHGIHLFQKTLTISSPNVQQRVEMLKNLIVSKPLIDSATLGAVEWLPLAEKMEGFVAHDLEMVVDRTAHAAIALKGLEPGRDLLLLNEDFEKALVGFEPTSLRGLNLHPAGVKGWCDVGGLDDVKRALVETLLWPTKYPALFAKCPLPMRSGVLLYGPPGTGKTLLAGVVAKECGMHFISIKGPELLSKYIGASEQAVRDLFERASNARPCIIFFDEFDSLAPRRGHDSTGVTDRVVNQLLTQMDGVEGREGVYVLAATSRPDLIDPALLRPGRLDKSLYCPLPLSEERKAILGALSGKMALAADVQLGAVADACRDFSGADLQGLLYNAQLKAIHRIYGRGDIDRPHSFKGRTSTSSSSSDGTDQDLGTDGFVNIKYAPGTISETEVPRKSKKSDWSMVHIPKLEEGPVALSATTCETIKQQLDAISSSLYGWSKDNGNVTQPSENKPPVQVTQEDLMAAIDDMRPSVSPTDRQHYEDIYRKFVKSRKGTFHVESTSKRATLA